MRPRRPVRARRLRGVTSRNDVSSRSRQATVISREKESEGGRLTFARVRLCRRYNCLTPRRATYDTRYETGTRVYLGEPHTRALHTHTHTHTHSSSATTCLAPLMSGPVLVPGTRLFPLRFRRGGETRGRAGFRHDSTSGRRKCQSNTGGGFRREPPSLSGCSSSRVLSTRGSSPGFPALIRARSLDRCVYLRCDARARAR